jgi:hypothetical protein
MSRADWVFSGSIDWNQVDKSTAEHQQDAAKGNGGGIPINLTLGTTQVIGSYAYGPMPNSGFAGGVDISVMAQNCNGCAWAQVVTRTGNFSEGPKKDGNGVGPLYGDEGLSPSLFADRPATWKSEYGTFTGVAVLGAVNVSQKTFSAKGAMTYGYGVSRAGGVSMTIAPRSATRAETKSAIHVLRQNSPDWHIH